MEEVQIGEAIFKIFVNQKSFEQSIDTCLLLNSSLTNVNFIKRKHNYEKLFTIIEKKSEFLFRTASANKNASCFDVVDFTAVYPGFETFTVCKQDNDFKQNLPFICYKIDSTDPFDYVKSYTGLSIWTILGVSLFCIVILVVIGCTLARLQKREHEEFMLEMNELRREINVS